MNGQGRLQAAARAIPPPGEAQEDWQVFVNLGLALGASSPTRRARRCVAALAEAMSGNPTYAGLATMGFARPVSARHWLQASNPSERWKWDFMFQDLPPVKFEVTPRDCGTEPEDSAAESGLTRYCRIMSRCLPRLRRASSRSSLPASFR